jgi:hypothetical protein
MIDLIGVPGGGSADSEIAGSNSNSDGAQYEMNDEPPYMDLSNSAAGRDDDHDEATPGVAPLRRSPARPFAVLPHHRLGVLPLENP